MSFINLMANDVWSDSDITRRTEAMVRAEFSADEEIILNRKLQGAALGAYTLTPEDIATVQAFNAAVTSAAIAGSEARADMTLLRQAMEVEALKAELALIPLDEEFQPQRDVLEAQIASFDEAVDQLVLDREENRLAETEVEEEEILE